MRVFLLIAALLAVYPASAQTADGVRAVIDQLFDGMRAGDAEAVAATIHPEARFQTTLIQDGEPVLHTGSAEAFVDAVGSPHDQIWDEKIWNVEILVDDRLAQAWMGYAFYLGDTFTHCGVNAFQFFHDGESWRIIQVTDTRRQGDCGMPDDL